MSAPLTYPPSLPLIAALPEYPALSESIIYQLNGLVVVFTALSLIWGLLEVMAFWFKRQTRRAVAAVVPAPAPVAPAASGADPGPETLAAISAAVHVAVGADSRVTAVVRVDAPDQGWGLEGRRQIHSARKVR